PYSIFYLTGYTGNCPLSQLYDLRSFTSEPNLTLRISLPASCFKRLSTSFLHSCSDWNGIV
ncbi:hypothetical protein, partial [Acinetobacter baumannii]|uniref:hypothetical protein n=1 Tax=Acinetobacter baumannii TaxID=470 RepID=UPI00197AF7BF